MTIDTNIHDREINNLLKGPVDRTKGDVEKIRDELAKMGVGAAVDLARLSSSESRIRFFLHHLRGLTVVGADRASIISISTILYAASQAALKKPVTQDTIPYMFSGLPRSVRSKTAAISADSLITIDRHLDWP